MPLIKYLLYLEVLKLHSYETLLSFSFFILRSSFSQSFVLVGLNQPAQLVAHAGSDMSISPGSSVTLGEMQSATGGTPSYSYLWSPADGLNNTSIANPTASPTQTTSYTLTVIDAAGCSSSDVVLITVVNPIQNNEMSGFRLFPNPTNQQLKVEFPESSNFESCLLIDSQGKEISNTKVTRGQTSLRFDISNLPSGLYFVRFMNKVNHTDLPFICK